jgi:predicted nucleic acid-binding protein
VIYLDASVVLADLFAEERIPPEALWRGELVSSRLLEYEVWTRVYARAAGRTHGPRLTALLAAVDFIELSPLVLSRALRPFPINMRTLDALHLATIDFLHQLGDIELATYDARLARAAGAMEISLFDLTE